MSKNIKELWNEYFGKAWNEITGFVPEMGAILLDKVNREFLLDESSREILGISWQPNYEQISEGIEKLRLMGEVNAPIKLKVLESDSNIMVAIIYSENRGRLNEIDFNLDIISQKSLLNIIERESRHSVLMLAAFGNIENDKLYDTYHSAAIKAIMDILPEEGEIAFHDKHQYWIYAPIDGEINEESKKICYDIQSAVEKLVIYNEKGHKIKNQKKIKITMGVSFEDSFAVEKMNEAGVALFEAFSRQSGEICIFDKNQFAEIKKDYKEVELLSRILGQNLITHVFQPIIDAHTGDIVGYEALMRTDESIGLSPLQILDLAAKYGRLYEIEKITFRNGLKFISENQMMFIKKKLYINSMPAYYLHDDDWNSLVQEYGELMEKLVIEMTEQTELSDESLNNIKERIKSVNAQMAIDDYGTGYSNTSNLLRYNPMVVKIDRSLISGIDTNQKLQKMVTSIVDFLHNSGYVALAEGVETLGELRYMIEAGADRIQGYYVSKPKPFVLSEVASSVVEDVKTINQELSGEILRVYHPKEGEIIHTSFLCEHKYTVVIVDRKEVTFVGDIGDRSAAFNIIIKENTDCLINLHDLRMISTNSEPTIRLSEGCRVTLNCIGNSLFDRKGIIVPKGTSLDIVGNGNLRINSDMKDCYGIGNDSKHAHGQININLDGELEISTNGDRFIGIGAGFQAENKNINISNGRISINGTGGNGVGIGCIDDYSEIKMSNCTIMVTVNSASAVQMGSMNGKVNLHMRDVEYKGVGNGTQQCGIGVLHSGVGDVIISKGLIDIDMKGERLSFIGTDYGDIDVDISLSKVNMYGEGANLVGIGDLEGAGDFCLTDDELCCKFSSGNLRSFGSRSGKLIMENCKES